MCLVSPIHTEKNTQLLCILKNSNFDQVTSAQYSIMKYSVQGGRVSKKGKNERITFLNSLNKVLDQIMPY